MTGPLVTLPEFKVLKENISSVFNESSSDRVFSESPSVEFFLLMTEVENLRTSSR